jgi:transcriptional regulator with XRE-family HTH domain
MLRVEAGLTGREFARRAGWADATNVSKVEKAQRTITADHVRLWCQICGTSERHTESLLAEQAAVAGMWLTNQQLKQGGLRRAQEAERDKYQQALQMRFYASKGIPGLLQTEAYAMHALRSIRMEFGVEDDDVAEAVDERMARKVILRRHGRFAFVLEEETLRHRTCPADVHREQLESLLEQMKLPAVSLGIIPWATERAVAGYGVWPDESFLITDDRLVNVELVSGYLSLTHPDEVRMYVRSWERLAALAVHGDRAAKLLRDAIEALPVH